MRFAVPYRVALLALGPTMIACSSPERENDVSNTATIKSSDGNRPRTLEVLQRHGLACSPDVLSHFRGRVASETLAEEMMTVTDTNLVRWVRPGGAFTGENLGGRLTVYLDQRDRVTQAICG